MPLDFSVQSLQFRRQNRAGNLTLRYVWDVVSRTDSSSRMLIETWGGKPDGYIRTFKTDMLLGKYLSARIAKGVAVGGEEGVEMQLAGGEDYRVFGPLNNLGKALTASNHEKAKLRLKVVGANTKWDSDACFNKTMNDLDIDCTEDITCDELNQVMASRVRATFKPGGNYPEHIIAIDEFMTSADESLSDVLGGEPVSYPPMDRERIMEVIEVADGLKDSISSVVSTREPKPEVHIPEPVIERGSEWGGWA